MAFTATHCTPDGGLDSWPTPDCSLQRGPHLGARLEVQVLERRGPWAHVACSNGWSAWVDGRQPAALGPPPAPPPPTETLLTSPPDPAPPRSPPQPPPATPSQHGRVGEPRVGEPRAAAGPRRRVTAPLVGAALVLIGSWLPWIPGLANSFNVSLAYLATGWTGFGDPASIGIVLVLLALGGGIRAGNPRRLVAASACGALALLPAVVFTLRLGHGVPGLGTVVTALGSLVLLFAVGRRWRR